MGVTSTTSVSVPLSQFPETLPDGACRRPPPDLLSVSLTAVWLLLDYSMRSSNRFQYRFVPGRSDHSHSLGQVGLLRRKLRGPATTQTYVFCEDKNLSISMST